MRIAFNTKQKAFAVSAYALLALFTKVASFSFSTPGISSSKAVPDIGEAPDGEIALALAGGGLRAASACFGALRGLQQKKVIHPETGKEVPAMDLVGYNSAISGGSLPAMLYSYAQVPTDELLETDRVTDPSKITKEDLSRMPTTSMGYVLAQKPDSKNILKGTIKEVLLNPLNLSKVHSLWSAGLYKMFCEPLNMPRNKYFTSSKAELDKILAENPNLKEDDFLLPREDVKANMMILASMHGYRLDRGKYMDNYQKIYSESWAEHKSKLDAGEKYPSMTDIVLSVRDKYGGHLPMPYMFTPDVVENKYSGTVNVRRKKVEYPESNSKTFEWGAKSGKYGRKSRLSVEFMTALSVNFLGSSYIGAGGTMSRLLTGLRTVSLSNGSGATQRFADGGTNDLMGVVPLVARGTKHIISVYVFNQNPPICGFNNTYANCYNAAPATSLDDPDFDAQFEEWLKWINPRITAYFGHFNIAPINQANVMNHIFNDPNLDRLKELMITYNSLFKAGEPLIATLKDLEVIDNPFWSIKGGKTVDLTLMYLNMPKKFSENVPEEAISPPEGMSKTNENGQFTNESFSNVPELKSDGADMIHYSHEEVNMMGYLGSWMVHHSWDGLKGHDGKEKFEGFGKIFSKR